MSALLKYVFRIRTRNGLILDGLTVQARDRTEAERKINQIYHYCEVLECQENAAAAARPQIGDVEGVIALISETRDEPNPVGSPPVRPSDTIARPDDEDRD